jgi:hypothetical protein
MATDPRKNRQRKKKLARRVMSRRYFRRHLQMQSIIDHVARELRSGLTSHIGAVNSFEEFDNIFNKSKEVLKSHIPMFTFACLPILEEDGSVRVLVGDSQEELQFRVNKIKSEIKRVCREFMENTEEGLF